jgi:thiamine pyrophosphate-dependent acetolactate synthase large subunit-like protein
LKEYPLSRASRTSATDSLAALICAFGSCSVKSALARGFRLREREREREREKSQKM